MIKVNHTIPIGGRILEPGQLCCKNDFTGVDLKRLIDIGAVTPIGNDIELRAGGVPDTDTLLGEIEELHGKIIRVEEESEQFKKESMLIAKELENANSQLAALKSKLESIEAENTLLKQREKSYEDKLAELTARQQVDDKKLEPETAPTQPTPTPAGPKPTNSKTK